MRAASASAIRVFLVDDQPMVRAGFRMLIDSQADLRVVGEAGDGIEALEKLSVTATDVVLMDVRMPRLDGVETVRRLNQRPDTPHIIVLTTFDLDEYAFAALQAGASAFLLKDAEPEVLLGAIRSVHAGDAVVAPSTTRRLIDQFIHGLRVAPTASSEPDPRLNEITERELEVLILVGRGLSNAEISAELHVAETTVKTHVSHLLTKTNSRDRVQLVVLAYETDLIPRDDSAR